MATRNITFREAINEAMRLEMRRDPTVILFGEDVAGGATLDHMEGENKEAWGGVLGVSTGLAPEFGRNRVLDTPISESGSMPRRSMPSKSAFIWVLPTKTASTPKLRT